MDPLAEKYPSISPYVYCADNPVMFTDDGGMDLVIFGANNSSITFTTELEMPLGKGTLPDTTSGKIWPS